MNSEQKDRLRIDLQKLAARHGAIEFILVFSHVVKTGDVIDEIEISSISQEQEQGACRQLFQWLKRQIILKLQ